MSSSLPNQISICSSPPFSFFLQSHTPLPPVSTCPFPFRVIHMQSTHCCGTCHSGMSPWAHIAASCIHVVSYAASFLGCDLQWWCHAIFCLLLLLYAAVADTYLLTCSWLAEKLCLPRWWGSCHSACIRRSLCPWSRMKEIGGEEGPFCKFWNSVEQNGELRG